MTHLRSLLGEATYESLARKGEAMTIAEMVTFAYDQIDQARAELKAASKQRRPPSYGASLVVSAWGNHNVVSEGGCQRE